MLIKCDSNGKRYATNICQHLESYLQPSISRKTAKGLFQGNAVMITTGESLGVKVTYQDGKNSPVLLNVCPSCGGKLHSVSEQQE